jgi:hypothetical protein
MPAARNPLLGNLPQDVGEVPDVQEHEAPAPVRREDDRKHDNRGEAEQARSTAQPFAAARWRSAAGGARVGTATGAAVVRSRLGGPPVAAASSRSSVRFGMIETLP